MSGEGSTGGGGQSGAANMNAGAASGGAGNPNGATSGGAGSGAGGAASGGGMQGDWMAGFADDAKGYVTNKGWKAPSDLLESYRGLEKALGTPQDRLVTLPSKDDDAEGWGKVFDRLGRPGKPDDYKIPMPAQGGDENFAKWAKGAFHELGLSQKQAEKLTAKWNDFAQTSAKGQIDNYKAQIEQESASLKKEWGQAYEQNVKVGQRAAAEFGIDAKTIDKLEGALGYAGVMKLMHNIGSKLSEDSFEGGTGDGQGGGFGGAMSPAEAAARIAELRADPGFVTRFIANDADARKEMDRLHKFLA